METKERLQSRRGNAKGFCENEKSFRVLDNLRSRASRLADVGVSPPALKQAGMC